MLQTSAQTVDFKVRRHFGEDTNETSLGRMASRMFPAAETAYIKEHRQMPIAKRGRTAVEWIFKAIGWKLNDPEPCEIPAGRPAGLALVFSAAGSLSPAAQALRDAPRIYQIDAETFCDRARNIRSRSFVFTVGPAVRE